MSEITTVRLDLAKNVFQLHGADARGGALLRKKLRRAQVLAFFATLPPCVVAMEACGGAHFWGRELAKLGHDVGVPLRQTVGLVASLIEMARLDWLVPDYSTFCRRQARLAVQIPYRRPNGPVTLLVDSTGIKFRGDGEWQVRKHGASRRKQ